MYYVIVNPASRSGRGMKIWKEQIEPALTERRIPFQSCFSEKPGDVGRLTEEILSSSAERPVHLIVLGGDGTMNEVLDSLPSPDEVIIGYIPTGSSNDLARDLKLPKDPRRALDCILSDGKPTLMDLGTVTYEDGSSRRFCVSCGIGYDAAICEEALRSGMKRTLNKIGLGKLVYLGVALKQLLATKPVSATLTLENGEAVTVSRMLFTACMLHRFEGGGFMFAPDADATDGILNMCVAGNLSKALILVALPTAFRGKHYRFRGIDAYRARELTITAAAPLWVHTDGEVVRRASRIRISCERQCVRMMKP